MAPLLLLMVLVAGLLALLPVWRLHVAGWPARWLVTSWIVYAVGILVVLRLPTIRLMIPIVVLAFLAPFVAGPERVTRVLGRKTTHGVVIDVTPHAPGPPETPRHVVGEVIDDDTERPA